MTTRNNPRKNHTATRSKQSLRMWLRLLVCESIVEQHIRAKLRNEYNITLPQFDVLAELDYIGKPMSMTDLSKQLMVSNGNVTGVIDRLARDAYVKRMPAKNDRRVQLIKLTDKGIKSFQEMAKQHEHWIAELFYEIPVKDMEQLTVLLAKSVETLKATLAGESIK